MNRMIKPIGLATTATLAVGLMVSTWAFAFSFSPPNAATPFASSGPFDTTRTSGGLSCSVFRPTGSGLSSGHPVIIWGNGTGASPTTYSSGLHHWASYGFVVVAANTSNAGTGTTMVNCLNWATQQHNSATGALSGALNLNRVGVAGHSQGGGGTLMAARDPRFTATVPMQPFILGLGHQTSSQFQQHARMLLLSGGSDLLAGPTLNQAPVFASAPVPIFWATRSGAGHFEPTGSMGEFRGIATAWWLHTLRDDSAAGQQASSLFTGINCGMCNPGGWSIQRKDAANL